MIFPVPEPGHVLCFEIEEPVNLPPTIRGVEKEGTLEFWRERDARLKSGRREGMQAQMTAMEGSMVDQMPALM